MTEIAVVLVAAAAHGDDFDFRIAQTRCGAEIFLRLAKPLDALRFFGDSEKHVRHAVIVAGMEKILSCCALMSGSERRSRSSFGFLGKPQPLSFPGVFITRLDILHRASDVENISAALLRLGDQPQCVSAEGMIGK